MDSEYVTLIPNRLKSVLKSEAELILQKMSENKINIMRVYHDKIKQRRSRKVKIFTDNVTPTTTDNTDTLFKVIKESDEKAYNSYYPKHVDVYQLELNKSTSTVEINNEHREKKTININELIIGANFTFQDQTYKLINYSDCGYLTNGFSPLTGFRALSSQKHSQKRIIDDFEIKIQNIPPIFHPTIQHLMRQKFQCNSIEMHNLCNGTFICFCKTANICHKIVAYNNHKISQIFKIPKNINLLNRAANAKIQIFENKFNGLPILGYNVQVIIRSVPEGKARLGSVFIVATGESCFYEYFSKKKNTRINLNDKKRCDIVTYGSVIRAIKIRD